MNDVWKKDPDDVLDFGIDWSRWLVTADAIADSEWIVPAGITKNSDAHDDHTTVVWFSGGTAGEDYEVTNRITTTGGRTVDKTRTVQVRQR